MRATATRRWQTGALDLYDAPRWEALSPRDAAALVAYTDGEASAACALARELPGAHGRAIDTTYRRALALWCAGALMSDLHRATLAHVDTLTAGMNGAKPPLSVDARTCILWQQAALLFVASTDDAAPGDEPLLRVGEVLLSRISAGADERRYDVALVRALLAGEAIPSPEGVRFSPGSPAAAIAHRDAEALAQAVEADLVTLARLLERQRRSANAETLMGRTTGYVQRGELWLRSAWLVLARRAGLDLHDSRAHR